MAFVLETGQGVIGANAYADVPFVEDYLIGGRLTQFTALNAEEKEAAIIEASRAVDTLFSWKGTRLTLEQGLAWPRWGVQYDGFEITGVPRAVKQAAAEIIFLLLSGNELFTTSADKVVTSEKVDTLAITYATAKESGAAAATKFSVLNGILRGLYLMNGSGGSSVGAARVERV
jgi:hypothetical protein